VQIRQSGLSSKYQTDRSNSCKFIWNATKNCVHPQEVPFGYDVSWSRIRVGRNVVVRMSQSLWMKRHQEGCKHSQSLRCSLIFRVEVGVKIHHVRLSLNSLWIGRSILVQCCKVYQAQCCQLERKQVVKAIEAVQSRVIYCKAAPKPPDNTSSHHRKSTRLASNYSSSPLAHLQVVAYLFTAGLLPRCGRGMQLHHLKHSTIRLYIKRCMRPPAIQSVTVIFVTDGLSII
jgi:hypothetical protein